MSAASTMDVALPARSPDRPWWQHRRVRLAAVAMLAALALVLAVWWLLFRPFVSTADARVAAPLVNVALWASAAASSE